MTFPVRFILLGPGGLKYKTKFKVSFICCISKLRVHKEFISTRKKVFFLFSTILHNVPPVCA